MNPLTLVKRIQKITSTEAALGISEEASWHAKYKESAYVYVGGIPFDLTEGDLLAVFAHGRIAQIVGTWFAYTEDMEVHFTVCRPEDDELIYGEVVDVNLVRDKGTGKSKGFAFLAYEDQRSTILAVDNLNGAKLLGRIVRVDHVSKYKKKEEEDEEKEQQKREARGVCRAFQRGDCNRGAACRFSHDEQRSKNTGWGPKDNGSNWEHDKHEGPSKIHTREFEVEESSLKLRSADKERQIPQAEGNEGGWKNRLMPKEQNPKDRARQRIEKLPERHDKEPNPKEWDRRGSEKRSERHEKEADIKEDPGKRESEKRSRYDRDSSSHRHREVDRAYCRRPNR